MSKDDQPFESQGSGKQSSQDVLSQLLEAELAESAKSKPQGGLDLNFYIDILSRRRWLLILPFCLMLAAGSFLAVKLPKTYEASTLILIQPQKVPADYVRPVVSEDIESRISTLSQQIMSRTNLESIIEEYNLFAKPEQKEMFIEDKLADLRSRIKVDLSKKSRRDDPDAFSVSFQGENPETVMLVTSALASNFIDENIKIRAAQAIGTTEFLKDQLESTRVQLETLEASLQSYREKYMGGLPEQLDANLKRIERLQQQLNDKQEAVRDAKNRKILLSQQLSELQRFETTLAGAAADDSPLVENDPARKLIQLRSELEDLKSRYTDRHPDVVRLKTKIEELEAELKAGQTGETEGDHESPPLTVTSPGILKQQQQLTLQIAEVESEIHSLDAEIPNLKRQIVYYQKLVDETPKREQELMTLRRDYENMQQSYNSLLERKLQAEVSVNLEKKQIGEQFRVLDPAKLPTKPIKPDMRILFLAFTFLGLAMGGGLIFLLEYVDSSFKRMQEVESYLGLPVLGSMPEIPGRKEKLFQVLNQAATVLSLLVAVSLLGGFALMALKGVEPALNLFRDIVAL